MSMPNEKLKNACAALLEYGAAAQTYFKYKTDKLVNRELNLTEKYDLAYNSDMIDTFERLDDNALVDGNYNYDGILDKIGKARATLTLEGAVVIELIYPYVELQPEEIIDSYLLVWTEEDYDPAGDFNHDTTSYTFKVDLDYGTLNNVDGYIATLKDNQSKYVGIPTKECGDPVYFMAYFETENGIYCSPLKNYSPDTYINSKAGRGDNLAKACETLAVLSEKARIYFNYKLDEQ